MKEPPNKVLLRLREVRQWMPNLTTQELHKWEQAGVIRVLQRSPRSHKWYYTKELIWLVQSGPNRSK